jgi:hypothetical protein
MDRVAVRLHMQYVSSVPRQAELSILSFNGRGFGVAALVRWSHRITTRLDVRGTENTDPHSDEAFTGSPCGSM